MWGWPVLRLAFLLSLVNQFYFPVHSPNNNFHLSINGQFRSFYIHVVGLAFNFFPLCMCDPEELIRYIREYYKRVCGHFAKIPLAIQYF